MNLSKLGKRIRDQREKRRLTQAQLANSLHISAQAVSKWERGENAPDITMLQPLSVLLDRSIEWILGGTSENSNTFNATVFCTSHRGFARRSANSNPESIALWINGIFHTMTEAVLSNDGVPIKYTGDGFLAYFSGKREAERAINAAKACIDSVNDRELLITLNCGEIYLGAIGHHEYTNPDIMGATVNTVFLMNRWATKESKSQIIFSKCVDSQLESVNSTSIYKGDDLVSELFTIN